MSRMRHSCVAFPKVAQGIRGLSVPEEAASYFAGVGDGTALRRWGLAPSGVSMSWSRLSTLSVSVDRLSGV